MTKNFALIEFACPCCGVAKVDSRLPDALQELRDTLGTPIIINSGYRCFKHNAAVGGAKHSLHLNGMAADCGFPGHKLFDVYLMAVQIDAFYHGGIGVYVPWIDVNGRPHGNFLHLDIRKKRARWGKYRGKFISLEKALGLLEK